jgi:hypothetical protein
MTKVRENNLMTVYIDEGRRVRCMKPVPDNCLLTASELVEYQTSLGRTKVLISLHHRKQCKMEEALQILKQAEGETKEY